jgi:hypothetical protein
MRRAESGCSLGNLPGTTKWNRPGLLPPLHLLFLHLAPPRLRLLCPAPSRLALQRLLLSYRLLLKLSSDSEQKSSVRPGLETWAEVLVWTLDLAALVHLPLASPWLPLRRLPPRRLPPRRLPPRRLPPRQLQLMHRGLLPSECKIPTGPCEVYSLQKFAV